MNYPNRNIVLVGFVIFGLVSLLVLMAFGSGGGRQIIVPERVETNPVFGVLPSVNIQPVWQVGDKYPRFENKIPKSEIASLPKTTPVYKYTSEVVFDRAAGQKVASFFKVTGLPERLDNGSLLWQDDRYDIAVNERDSSLWVFLTTVVYDKEAPSETLAADKVEEFLKASTLSSLDIKVDRGNIKKVFIDPHDISFNPDPVLGFNATLVPVVRDLPYEIVSLPNDQYLMEVLVGDGGAIVRVKFFYRRLDKISVGKYGVKDFDRAWQEVLAGKATVVDFGEATGAVISGKKMPVKLQATSVKVSLYEIREGRQFMQPVFNFEGLATFSDDSTVPFTLLLPAVEY